MKLLEGKSNHYADQPKFVRCVETKELCQANALATVLARSMRIGSGEWSDSSGQCSDPDLILKSNLSLWQCAQIGSAAPDAQIGRTNTLTTVLARSLFGRSDNTENMVKPMLWQKELSLTHYISKFIVRFLVIWKVWCTFYDFRNPSLSFFLPSFSSTLQKLFSLSHSLSPHSLPLSTVFLSPLSPTHSLPRRAIGKDETLYAHKWIVIVAHGLLEVGQKHIKSS